MNIDTPPLFGKTILLLGWTMLASCSNEAGFQGSTSSTEPKNEDQIPAQPTPAEEPPSQPSQTESPTIEQPPKLNVDDPLPPQTPEVKDRPEILWLWDCQLSDDQTTTPDTGVSAILQGRGPHTFDIADNQQYPLVVSGKLCPPKEGLRDILFIVDVSGSMQGNDPLTQNSCSRLTAISQVLQSLPQGGSALVGITTFAGDLSLEAKNFVTPNDINSTNYLNTNTLCANANNGGTDYQKALQSAETLFKAARENAYKEIYFISDGAPQPASSSGVDTAKILRDTLNVQIATVFLHRNGNNNEDRVMREEIASKDKDDKPLHRRGNASELAKSLAELAKVTITEGIFAFRGVSQNSWLTKKLEFDPNDFTFKMPIDKLSLAKYLFGIDFKYEYYDQTGRKYGDEGSIIWKKQN